MKLSQQLEALELSWEAQTRSPLTDSDLTSPLSVTPQVQSKLGKRLEALELNRERNPLSAHAVR